MITDAVLSNLILKRDRLKGHENVRPLLLTLGGGTRGVYGAGAVAALHMLGFANIFTDAVGISTGAGINAYFLAGFEQTLLGTSLYYEECATKAFIDFSRWNMMVDIGHVIRAMQTGRKKLDCEAISSSPTSFHVVVTAQDGTPHILDAKAALPDMVSAIHASMAIPAVYAKKIRVNGEDYVDGALNPFPIRQIIDRFQPTDIIVLPNQTRASLGKIPFSLRQALLSMTAIRNCSFAATGRAMIRQTQIHHALRHAKTCVPNVKILWPPEKNISVLTTDAYKLKEAVIASAQATFRAFGLPEQKIDFL
jgi:predicted patatin/cPLA2 family phospholipase